jgi:uncharacterized membrane protein (DUF485 family)
MLEAVSSTLVGWVISFFANVLVLPLFGYAVTYAHAFWIGVAFTAISVVRSYLWRRGFEWLRIKEIIQ